MEDLKENEQTYSQVTLESLVNQVRELFVKLNGLIETYQSKLQSTTEREKGIRERECDLENKINEFSAREDRVSTLENIVTLKKKADDSIQDSQARLAQLKNEREAFESYKLGETNRLNDLRANTQKESDNLVKQQKYIDDEVSKRVKDILSKIDLKATT